jgi:drug/metabolite transporter (DMT)-like permease
MAIAAGNFLILIVPSFLVLLFSDFFNSETLSNPIVHQSLGYLIILAVIGTGVAKVMFNKLVQMSTPVFASSVTYLIPIIALFWGFLDGESFSLWQGGAALVILLGVLLTNRK